jgi:uncharacterized membrane protein YeaQ/YmgE (transglycosylase-associated protein family)
MIRPQRVGDCPMHGGLGGALFAEDVTMILNLVLWCLFGLVAGAIAQFLMPGRDPGQATNPTALAITVVLGIIGAAVGGLVSSRLFGWDVTGFNLPSLAVAVGGALLLLIVYRLVTSNSGHTASRH